MFRREWLSTNLALAIVLWICTIPVFLILALPFMGTGRTLVAAAVFLVIYLVVCLYFWPRVTSGSGRR